MNIKMLDFNAENIIKQFQLEINNVITIQQLQKLKIIYLSKKGFIKKKIKQLPNLSIIDRKNFGNKINYLKKYIKNAIYIKQNELKNNMMHKNISLNCIDVSLPGKKKQIGSMHPINTTIYNIKKFFNKCGFDILSQSLEVEHQYNNFDALNIPNYHPARNIQDTFWFDSERLLRTQTSNMQVHTLKKKKLPIKMIVSGKVYRKDYDKTHSPMFHQIEGLVIDQNVNFANLKWIINNFLYNFFGKKMCIRFRPSYFPFTVLSSEVDIKNDDNKWLEVLGCGLIHPDILDRFNINRNIYSGLAFGIGVERITMLYYGVQDLRWFYKNNISFLKQFNQSRYFDEI